ncbi:MAG: GIY-YIG-like endonuclease [Terrestrivirus sp.]|uniref:GIY-YIG-like endonuclease n=1 Tax=Terrestrivirus sp. TaxID=2487775 RepID=A0A3G4ZRD8_9VIRU|nr:MAG: GIY-YIG-like endonuclease [Terrestrivirus sp.]
MEETINTGVIYKITCTITGKEYVGQAVSYMMNRKKIIKHGTLGRFENHKKDAKNRSETCPKLYAAMNKYGDDNFIVEQLEVCEAIKLSERESFYIKKYDTIQNGYNIMLSYNDKVDDPKKGERFTIMKRESRVKKISATLRELNSDEEFKKKMHAVKLENKKLDHNGNLLPIYIYNQTSRNNPGYRVTVRKNGIRNEKSFTDPNKTMDEKLELAKKALSEIDSSFDEIKNNREKRVIEIQEKHIDYDGITPLPKYIKTYSDRYGHPGYFASIIKNDKTYNKRCCNSDLSNKEKLDIVNKWVQENKENKENK